MNWFYNICNSILIIVIAFVLLFNPSTKSIKNSYDVKCLSTSAFNNVDFKKIESVNIDVNDSVNDTVNDNVNDSVNITAVKEEKKVVSTNNVSTISNEKVEVVNTITPVPVSNVIDSISGGLAAYGPDCSGCSGMLSSGFNARNSIYYNDATYGSVRILAGDKQYPFGTIVRVSGTSIGSFNAIVLDRGGGVGIGKRFLFDLLFPTEHDASIFGSYSNVKFEIMRLGY